MNLRTKTKGKHRRGLIEEEDTSKYFQGKWKNCAYVKTMWKVSVKRERFRIQVRAKYNHGTRFMGDLVHFNLKICGKSNTIFLRDGTGFESNRKEDNFFYYKSTVVQGLFIQEIQMK